MYLPERNSILKAAAAVMFLLNSVSVCVSVRVCVCDRDLGGEAVLWETIRGALSAQRERYCLSDRGLCHHAAGMWHAGRGQSQTNTDTQLKHATGASMGMMSSLKQQFTQ